MRRSTRLWPSAERRLRSRPKGGSGRPSSFSDEVPYGRGVAVQSTRRSRHRAELRALARRGAAADRRGCGRAHRRPLRGARRDRPVGHRPRAFPRHGDRRGDAACDRRAPARSGNPRHAHPGRKAAPTRPPQRAPRLQRVPGEPPTDEDVPRRSGPAPQRRVREPLLDREAGGRVHAGGRGPDRTARLAGGGGDRERAPLRVGDPLVTPARVVDRGRECTLR